MLTNKIIGKSEIIQLFNPSQNEVHECIVTKGHYYNVIFHPLVNQFFGQSESLQRWHLFIPWWNIQKRSFPHTLWLWGRRRKGHNMHSCWLRTIKWLIRKTSSTLIWKSMLSQGLKSHSQLKQRNEEKQQKQKQKPMLGELKRVMHRGSQQQQWTKDQLSDATALKMHDRSGINVKCFNIITN